MKNKFFVFIIMAFLSLNLRAQTDSLYSKNKWEKSHRVGVEFGNKLFFYDLFYQYSRKKNKHNFGLKIGGNLNPYFGLNKDLVYGCILGLSYQCALTNKIGLRLCVSQSALFNHNVLKGDYDLTDWYARPEKIIFITSTTTGINFRTKSVNYFLDFGVLYLNSKIEGVGLNDYIKNSVYSYCINFGASYKI